MNSQIKKYLDSKFNTLPSHHSGFRKQYSAMTASLKACDDVFEALDVRIIVLDFS